MKMKTLAEFPSTADRATHGLPFVHAGGVVMARLEVAAGEIASTRIPILLAGEVGTGKEMFARRIHELSGVEFGSFVRIICAAITEDRLVQEIAFKPRAEEAPAGAGTILLDEIGDLDVGCQRELLGLLPTEATTDGRLAARIISTTTRNLEDEVRAGRFRSDLYYRLNGVCLRLPALRERRDDIPVLTEHFLTKHAADLHKPRPMLSQKCLEALLSYAWPGNVRELENMVKKIVAMNDESLAISDLAASPHPAGAVAPLPARCSLKAAARAASRKAERQMILEALARTRWNRKRAAQELQISYKSLLCKLKQIGPSEAEETEWGEIDA
ncbi:MAG TPA: sigma 54-interacting transcriptional regulator [Candidatus Cybelea sp.]|nr:sigma 54-interacting transcriptional regulator [Candidatus Cybelea sp.]